MWMIAAPARAASMPELAISAGVTGTAGFFTTVSPAPVSAQVMMVGVGTTWIVRRAQAWRAVMGPHKGPRGVRGEAPSEQGGDATDAGFSCTAKVRQKLHLFKRDIWKVAERARK